MKIWKYIIIGFFIQCVVSTFFAYDFMSKIDPENILETLSLRVVMKNQKPSQLKLTELNILLWKRTMVSVSLLS